MPKTVRWALLLIGLLSLLFVVDPPSSTLSLLVRDTLPRLRNPFYTAKLRSGIPLDQWTKEWVPLTRSNEGTSLLASNGEAAAFSLKEFPATWQALYTIEDEWASGGPDHENNPKVIMDAARLLMKAEPNNAFPITVQAVELNLSGNHAGALKALKLASGLKSFSAHEDELFKMLERKAAGEGRRNLAAAQAAYQTVQQLPHPDLMYVILSGLAKTGNATVRLQVMKVGRLLRVGSGTIQGALKGAMLEAQTASLNPPLEVALQHAGAKADADWVTQEMSAAVTWRMRLESKATTSAPPDRDLLQVGLLWFHLAGLFLSAVVLLVMCLGVYVFAMPVARRLPSAWLPLLASIGLTLLFCVLTPSYLSVPYIEKGKNSVTLTSLQLAHQMWSGPLCIVTAALLAAFLPFLKVEPQPKVFTRFMALLRDTTFFSLPLLMLLVYLNVAMLPSYENQARTKIAASFKPETVALIAGKGP